jgi:hypothetical protein
MRIIDESACEESKEHKAMIGRQKLFLTKLNLFIEGGKIDDKFKTRLKRAFDISI